MTIRLCAKVSNANSVTRRLNCNDIELFILARLFVINFFGLGVEPWNSWFVYILQMLSHRPLCC